MIDFTVGSRRLLAVPRSLATVRFTLADIIAGTMPASLEDAPQGDGLRVLSAPAPLVADLQREYPRYITGGRQDYARHYIAMDGSFADYMAGFSGKTRSTLRRKARKLAEACGAGYTVSEYRSTAEVERFWQLALPLSALTYQARLLDAGLPDDPASRAQMLAQAERGDLRCFLLSAGDRAIAYLVLPVEDDTLNYAFLGYDPDWARHSPGTVLQMEALERLFAENRFRHFDFTEGDGTHKALFGTHSIACSSFVLLKPTIANRTLLAARDGFDTAVSGARSIADASGAMARIRSILRA